MSKAEAPKEETPKPKPTKQIGGAIDAYTNGTLHTDGRPVR